MPNTPFTHGLSCYKSTGPWGDKGVASTLLHMVYHLQKYRAALNLHTTHLACASKLLWAFSPPPVCAGSSSGQRATHCPRPPWRDATPHSRAPRRPPDPSQRPITAPSPSCPRRRCDRARRALGPPAGRPPGRRRSCTPCHGTPRRSAAATRCRRRPARGSPLGSPP